jgi:hypothetical protein
MDGDVQLLYRYNLLMLAAQRSYTCYSLASLPQVGSAQTPAGIPDSTNLSMPASR